MSSTAPTTAETTTYRFAATQAVTLVTAVSGSASNIAQVSIWINGVQAWVETLTQIAPTVHLPMDVRIDGNGVVKGSTFTLTVPTSMQMGQMHFNGTLLNDGSQLPLISLIATWLLQ